MVLCRKRCFGFNCRGASRRLDYEQAIRSCEARRNQRSRTVFSWMLLPILFGWRKNRVSLELITSRDYGTSLSKETISRITDTVIEGMNYWCARPLSEVCAAAFIDSTAVKICDVQVLQNTDLFGNSNHFRRRERSTRAVFDRAGTGGESAKVPDVGAH